MSRQSKRSVPNMFSGAIAVQENETISQLKAEIESLNSLASSAFELPVSNIIPLQLPGSMKQPRLYFDQFKMERLENSISKHGVLEPILVRRGKKDTYEIISGERRWRCCKRLAKETIPAIVREMSDTTALEAALIAHLLNEEITAIEQTESILSLLSLRLDLGISEIKNYLYQTKNADVRRSENSRILTPQNLSLVEEILGEFGMKLSSFVSNRLPMLNLEPVLLDAVKDGTLSPTNAVIINRQPKELHDELIYSSKGLTKQELMTLLRSKKSIDAVLGSNSKDGGSSNGEVSERILERIKAVRKNKKLLSLPKVQSHILKIDKLLAEIEALNTK
ncbi:MAG: ParB/RepB/Spo0J family partition protein [Acaryochloris sp. CRU_2_0]|nr:ParB/RepB/Spo0J family partition protein [Acaryochloris sp. CRU_2_0]